LVAFGTIGLALVTAYLALQTRGSVAEIRKEATRLILPISFGVASATSRFFRWSAGRKIA
jgi:hypothetical protein